MRISKDQSLSEFVIAAATDEEVALVQQICSQLKPNEKMQYDGRNNGPPFTIFLKVRGEKIALRGTDPADEDQLKGMRDSLYFGASNAPIFLRETQDHDGRVAMVITLGICKQCRGGMINRVACEWQVCNECATKCSHVYVQGAVHGGKVHLGEGCFCEICGRIQPDTEMVMILGEDMTGTAEISPTLRRIS